MNYNNQNIITAPTAGPNGPGLPVGAVAFMRRKVRREHREIIAAACDRLPLQRWFTIGDLSARLTDLFSERRHRRAALKNALQRARAVVLGAPKGARADLTIIDGQAVQLRQIAVSGALFVSDLPGLVQVGTLAARAATIWHYDRFRFVPNESDFGRWAKVVIECREFTRKSRRAGRTPGARRRGTVTGGAGVGEQDAPPARAQANP